MDLIYQLGIRFYLLAVQVASLFNEKARRMAKGRKATFSYLEKNIDHSRPLVWVHCASLGEFEQGRPLIEQIKKQHPVYRVLLTFFSPSGYEIRKDYGFADYICYLPADTAHNAKNFIELTKPEKVFFIKYEYWYFYLDELKQRGIPTFSISSIFRENQLFFKPQGEFYRDILRNFDYFFVQNKLSKDLLKGIDISNVMVVGDTRFDRVREICSKAKTIGIAEKFKDQKSLMVLGSSWPNDIEKIAPFINKWVGMLKFIIAPHEIEEKNLQQIESQVKGDLIRFSNANPDAVHTSDILVIDNIGMLSSLYRYGEYAYIGGAFDHGIHNTLEAATFGIPIFIGKDEKNLKYQEAMDLVKLGAGFEIANWEEMDAAFSKLYSDKSAYKTAANAAKNYIDKNTGATGKIMEVTQKMVKI